MKDKELPPLWARIYDVPEDELQRDVCNLYFDEDAERYNTPCECSRCARHIPKKTELFGGLK